MEASKMFCRHFRKIKQKVERDYNEKRGKKNNFIFLYKFCKFLFVIFSDVLMYYSYESFNLVSKVILFKVLKNFLTMFKAYKKLKTNYKQVMVQKICIHLPFV